MVDLNVENWTYGAEHELADWHRLVELPEDFGIDTKDHTIVNSNGIAADPKGKYYQFGGEINTPPSPTPMGQAKYLNDICELFPEANVNYRSNLHIHVRVPGLVSDLEALKTLQQFNTDWLPVVLPLIEPIPKPTKFQYPDPEDFKGAMRRYNRRKVSHHTVIPKNRVERQLKAKTVEEFFAMECPQSKEGKPLWHFQPRAAVNVRQLLETNTIEFRHFPGTLNARRLHTCVNWCRDYLKVALGAFPGVHTPLQLYHEDYYFVKFPEFEPYVHWMEERYRKTCHDGTLTKEQITNNIEEILREESTGTVPR